MKIVVAGTGYVGLVTGVCLAEKGYNVTCVDVDEEKIKMMKEGISPIYEEKLQELMIKNYNEGRLNYTTDYASAYKEADIIFIGVGTPEQSDGNVNLEFVTTVAKQIATTITKDSLVVIKSTVPVGTNDEIEELIKNNLVNNVKIEVASNPEFLAQGTAVRDCMQANRIVIGTKSKEAETILRKLYEPFERPIVSVDRRSAELIKYASNSFLALKISYINEIANLCEVVGANIENVALGMSYDPRIGKDFLKAGVGFGGSCFPKDLKALKHSAESNGLTIKTIEAALEVNDLQRTVLYRKALERLGTFKDHKITILGLTFKPGTDDLREAPAIENIRLLLEQGAKIIVYDPVGMPNLQKIYPNEIEYACSPEEALDSSDVCFNFTEWPEIKEIKPETYRNLMKTPLIYDGRNICSDVEMAEAGIEYYSIGR